MNAIDFGDAQFKVTVSDFELNADRPEFSQFTFMLAGRGWSLLAPNRTESLGVVSARLGRFVADAPVRHWGAFVGLKTHEEVVARVASHGFGGSHPVSGFRRWEISSAFVQYSLSAQFDNNLGVKHAIAVRGIREETLIWQTKSGEVFDASIPIEKFESAFAAFVRWAEVRLASIR